MADKVTDERGGETGSHPGGSGAQAAALRMYEEVAPSVVRIISRGPDGGLSDIGTGFIVDDKGTIATDWHCVNKSADVFVQKGHKLYQAEVTKASPAEDLALMNTRIQMPGVKPIELGDASTVKVTDTVYGIGHAQGAGTSRLSMGKGAERMTQAEVVDRISVDSHYTPAQRAAQEMDFVRKGRDLARPMLRSEIHLEPGMSGGPLMDNERKVIGALDLAAEGVGYSTHVESLRKLVERGGGNQFVYSDVATPFAEAWKQHWKTSRVDQIAGDVFGITRAGADAFASRFPIPAGDGTTHGVYGARLYLKSSLEEAQGLADFKPRLAAVVQTAANVVALAGMVKMEGLGEKVSGAALVHTAAFAHGAAQFIPQRHIVTGRR